MENIARLIHRVAVKVIDHHETEGLHCDLKASNVLITKDGPKLIDSFMLQPGQCSPGYTPEWSAPEQIMGMPVSSKSDVYPLGMMLLALTSSQLIGEIRRIRIPDIDAVRDIDIFVNPSIFTYRPSDIFTGESARIRWKKLIERSLCFEQEKRISILEFIDELGTLIDDNTLNGQVSLEIGRNLFACVLPSGIHSVASIVEDKMIPHQKMRAVRKRTLSSEKEMLSDGTTVPG